MLRVAEPELMVEVPRTVEPSLKVIVPVGEPVPELGVTVAVKVTEAPKIDGLELLESVVVVGSLFTTFWFSAEL